MGFAARFRAGFATRYAESFGLRFAPRLAPWLAGPVRFLFRIRLVPWCRPRFAGPLAEAFAPRFAGGFAPAYPRDRTNHRGPDCTEIGEDRIQLCMLCVLSVLCGSMSASGAHGRLDRRLHIHRIRQWLIPLTDSNWSLRSSLPATSRKRLTDCASSQTTGECMTEFQIRPALSADLPAVAAVAEGVQTMVAVRRGLVGGPCPEFSASLTSYETAAHDPNTCFLVGIVGGRVAGYVMASIERTPDDLTTVPRACIVELAVGAEFRRRGIGSALLVHAEAWAEKAGLTLVQLAVWEFNDEALALYRRSGYETIMRKMEKVVVARDSSRGQPPVCTT